MGNNMDKVLRIKRLDERAPLPKRATDGSAGHDLHALIDEPLKIAPGQLVTVGTGLAIALPDSGYVALVFARSGLAVKHGIALSNGVGVIDSDYRGEIKIGLCNLGNEPYTIQPGERVAQLVVVPVCCLPLLEVDSLEETARGQGGFGSTGKI